MKNPAMGEELPPLQRMKVPYSEMADEDLARIPALERSFAEGWNECFDACMALRQPAPAQPVAAQPIGYIIADYMTGRRAEFEQNGIVMYAQKSGMATTAVYTAPPPAPVAVPAVAEGWKLVPAKAEPEGRKLLGYGDCRCILSKYCDGTCNPIWADAAPSAPVGGSHDPR